MWLADKRAVQRETVYPLLLVKGGIACDVDILVTEGR